MQKMSSLMSHLIALLLLTTLNFKADGGGENRTSPLTLTHAATGSIGGVVDITSRVGKEQKVAMEMAVRDICGSGLDCNKRLFLHIKDSSPRNSASNTIELVDKKQVQVLIGRMTPQEAILLSETDKNMKDIPIISLVSPAIPLPVTAHDQLPNFFQMSNLIASHMQCIAAIVSHFGWRKVTVLYEQSNIFSDASGIVTMLSDALEVVNSEIEHHTAITFLPSLSDREVVIEQELDKLRSKSNRIFVLAKSSLELAKLIFRKAKQMRMTEKGYVWIVPDEVSSLLDSADSSVLDTMQGVLGFKTNYNDASQSFQKFKDRFRKKYGSKYPNEEEHSGPSIFALRAYDAIQAISQALDKSSQKLPSEISWRTISRSNLEGLSGKIHFSNNTLQELPSFQIINVVGKSYRNMAFWSPHKGFLDKEYEAKTSNNTVKEFGPVYWPGGQITTPKQWANCDAIKPLRIAVPAKGAFNQFVNVNGTLISGFSIYVFEAAVKRLSYDLHYEWIPFYGTYDEMVQLDQQGFDAAVGDTEIMADRCQYAQFSQPYVDSGLVMVVQEKSEKSKSTWMLKTFTPTLWLQIAGMHMLVGFVVWLIERSNNPEFNGAGSMLWFCVTVIFYAQREQLKNNLARLVMAPWLFAILIIIASFTGNLTSRMTVSRLQPTILDVETLRSSNAPVGCNGNSFIVRYLTNVLNFKPENIKSINSIYDYPEAFRTGYIKAAFFVEPHANVFLGRYCKGYIKTGKTFKLGGFGFVEFNPWLDVFQKGSPLATDMSVAILEVIESGVIRQLEQDLLLSKCTASSPANDDNTLDSRPFFLIFMISGVFAGFGFIVAVGRMKLQLLQRTVRELTGKALDLSRIMRTKAQQFQLYIRSHTIPKTSVQDVVNQTPASVGLAHC